MSKYIGRQINVGVGIESTRGTAVAIQSWTPKTDLSFIDKAETIQDESSIGVITDARDSFVTKLWSEGDISGNIEANNIGYYLLGLFGTVSSAVATTGAYTHSFTLSEVNQGKTLTIGMEEPNSSEYAFALGSVESMTFTAEEGTQAVFTVTMKAKPGAVAVLTHTYAVDYKLLSRHSIFKTATNLAGLDAASAVCLKSFEITFTRNLEDDYCLGSQTPQDFIGKQFQIEGSFSLLMEDEVYKTYALAGTKRAVRFDLADTGTTIGISSNPTLRFDLPMCAMTEWAKTQGNDEVVTQTLTFKGLYSNTDTSAVNTYLTNTTATYVAA